MMAMSGRGIGIYSQDIKNMKWTGIGNRHNVRGNGSFQLGAWVFGLCRWMARWGHPGEDRWV